MVKKLYKHEFLAWLRVMPLIFGILLAVAGVNRVIQFFESDATYYTIINVSGIIMYVIALLVCLAAPIVFGVTRYYKNLFTGEGYLTFTLPVSTTQHLWTKTLTALCFSVASLLVALLSVVIITAGDMFNELCLAGSYILRHIPEEISGHFIGWVAEFIVLLLAAFLYSHLMFSCCVSVGQLFRKNRVLASVGAYFAYYIITQVFGTIFIILMVALENTQLMADISMFIDNHPYATVHIALCGLTVFYGIICAAFFLISRYVIRRRLNLE